MIGSAVSSALVCASTVPSAALIVVVDVVLSGIYVTDATNPQWSVMLKASPALKTGAQDDDVFADTCVNPGLPAPAARTAPSYSGFGSRSSGSVVSR